MSTKPENMAQSQLLMECKISIQIIDRNICRMTGESYDKVIDEVASNLPLKTIEAVTEVEEKLKEESYAQAMVRH